MTRNWPAFISTHWQRQNRCALCRETLIDKIAICSSCMQLLMPIGPHQCRCGLPCTPADAGNLCGRCLHNPPPFQACHCAWHYGFPLSQLINRYKHHGDLNLEPLLISIWKQELEKIRPPDKASLVPIPIHWRRHWQRGFNQSLRLAGSLSNLLQIPLLPALAQPQASPMQQGLSAPKRQQLKERFIVTCDVRHQTLILIDDVMTTGSTVRDAAHVLLGAGASYVEVWTLCRASKSG